jgi:hypothetical protein
MRVFLTLAILALPGFALAQRETEPARSAKAQKIDQASQERLAALEARLEMLLKEIQAIRGGKKVEIERKVEETTGGKRIVITGQPEGTGKAELKFRIQDGKATAVELQTQPRKTAPTEKGKRAIVLEGGVAKPIAMDAATTFFRVASDEDPNTVHLTRVTYTLGAEKAKALESFLKDNAKAKVLETKLDGDKLIVTTTPDVQQTVGQVVGLMTGKTVSARGIYRWDVQRSPMTPTTPMTPKAPEKPKPPKPAKPEKVEPAFGK